MSDITVHGGTIYLRTHKARRWGAYPKASIGASVDIMVDNGAFSATVEMLPEEVRSLIKELNKALEEIAE